MQIVSENQWIGLSKSFDPCFHGWCGSYHVNTSVFSTIASPGKRVILAGSHLTMQFVFMAKAQVALVAKEGSDEASYRQPPQNVEAEQALLGAILINNEAMYQVRDYLRADHFYEPVHQRIFSAIQRFFDKGLIANPVTLKQYFDKDEALAEIGGGEYLAKLAGAAATIIHIPDYCETIYDQAQRRALIGIGSETVNTAFDHDLDQSATAQIEAAEQKLFHLASQGASENSFKPIRTSITSAIQRAEFAFKNSGQVIGVSSGLTDLDRLLGGLQKSDLLILAGRPSMGKTALATSIAYYAAQYFQRTAPENSPTREKPLSVGFFSLEMSSEQLASRLLSGATGINSGKLRKGDLTHEEFAALARESHKLSSLPFFIDDTPALSIAALRTRARRLKRVHNLGLLVVDYLQLVRASNVNSQTNRVQEVSEVTQGLKAIAKELDVPVMALSQLSRAVEQREDKRPQLSDLRESGSIEQDADVVMFVYREEYYLMREMPGEHQSEKFSKWQEDVNRVHGIAEVIVSKQRNGPIGNVQLAFQSDLTKFSDLAHDAYMPSHHDNE